MFNQPTQAGGGMSAAYKDSHMLSMVLALIVTALAGPPLGELTQGIIEPIIEMNYGAEWIDHGIVAWKILMMAAIFLITKRFFYVMLVAAAMGAAQRWPMFAAL